MLGQTKQQLGKQVTGDKSDSKTEKDKHVDLDKLAKKIVALLLRELDIERERLGR